MTRLRARPRRSNVIGADSLRRAIHSSTSSADIVLSEPRSDIPLSIAELSGTLCRDGDVESHEDRARPARACRRWRRRADRRRRARAVPVDGAQRGGARGEGGVRAGCEPTASRTRRCAQRRRRASFPMPAPDFTAYDNNGKPVHLSDFRGKVVLLNFWASWCGVCRTEKPQLNEMAKDLVGDDFVVIALASDRSWTDVLVAIVDALGRRAEAHRRRRRSRRRSPRTRRRCRTACRSRCSSIRRSGDSNIGAIAASWGITAVPESRADRSQRQYPRVLRRTSATGSRRSPRPASARSSTRD